MLDHPHSSLLPSTDVARRSGPLALAFAALTVAFSGCGDGSGPTLGGTVSGLSGTLVLQNDGADDLTITEDGEFVFATALASGDTYSVTVASAPSNQNCTVANGAGTVASASVSDVAVTCTDKSWTHPSAAEGISPVDSNGMEPQVAMAANGDAIVVWSHHDGMAWVVLKSEYRDGVWTHPTSVDDKVSPDGQNATVPRVAMNDAGDAIIVWRQSNGLNTHIYMSEYRDGVWTHPLLADNISPSGQDAQAPGVAMADNGDAVIVWQQSDGTDQQILVSEYRDGAWAHPVTVADNISPDGGNVATPEVAMSPNGDTLVVWSQDAGVHWQAFKSEYRDGAWSHPSSLSDNISPDGSTAANPHVAMNEDGDAIVVWKQPDGAAVDRIFKSEHHGGTWTHPSALTDHISPDDHAAYPRVAMDAEGDAIIVWVQRDDAAQDQVAMSEYRGGVWTHPTSVTDLISPSGEDAYYPEVAMDDNGNAIVVWEQYNGSSYQVFMSEYRNGVWTHPTSLMDHISDDSVEAVTPQVAMDDNGDALIVWAENGVGYDPILVSEYR